MKITNVGYNYRHPEGFTIHRPNGSGDCILLIIKTEAFVCLRGERMAVPPNSVIVYKKGTPQLYGAAGAAYVNDWVHFDMDEEEERFLSRLGLSFDTVLPLGDVTELLSFIKNMFFELYSQNLYKAETVKRYFELLLIKICEMIRCPGAAREHPLYESFNRLRGELRLAPQGRWTVDEISRKLNLSRSYVQHLYKQFFGVSLVSDIRSHRMEHAKYLLSATDMTVTAVSRACGYDSEEHFMRTFKKETDMTPSQFRGRFCISGREIEQSKSRPPFSIKRYVNAEEKGG